jgi:hypothetical protein
MVHEKKRSAERGIAFKSENRGRPMVRKVVTFLSPSTPLTRLLAKLNIIRDSSRTVSVWVSKIGEKGNEKVYVD